MQSLALEHSLPTIVGNAIGTEVGVLFSEESDGEGLELTEACWAQPANRKRTANNAK